MKIRQDKFPALTEKQFASQIADLLARFGWRFYTVFEQYIYARRSSKGFPDFLAIRGERLLMIEVKSDTGRLTAEQESWLGAFAGCNIETHIWRPSTPLDEIVRLLRT